MNDNYYACTNISIIGSLVSLITIINGFVSILELLVRVTMDEQLAYIEEVLNMYYYLLFIIYNSIRI